MMVTMPPKLFKFLICYSTCWATTVTAAPKLPIVLPDPDPKASAFYLGSAKPENLLNIVPSIQAGLKKYLRDRANPIASVMLVEVETGKILAFAQGRQPEKWGAKVNANLHPHFPAASLFKTVVAGAVFELSNIDPLGSIGLTGGCAHVRPTGIWLDDTIKSFRRQMNLRKAYGTSCNGYFAKLAINTVGLKTLIDFAYRFGWDGQIDTDFAYEPSPMTAPDVRSTSVHAVGRYAAGFGYVGISAVHASWITLAIANDGRSKPLHLFANSKVPSEPTRTLISPTAAKKIRSIMDATIQGGTSSYAFRRGKHRRLRYQVGGKTGTLSGENPKGVTTWFSGMMPMENPKVVVSAVVVLEKLWHIKGPNLAAEALWLYRKHQQNLAKSVAKENDTAETDAHAKAR